MRCLAVGVHAVPIALLTAPLPRFVDRHGAVARAVGSNVVAACRVVYGVFDAAASRSGVVRRHYAGGWCDVFHWRGYDYRPKARNEQAEEKDEEVKRGKKKEEQALWLWSDRSLVYESQSGCAS